MPNRIQELAMPTLQPRLQPAAPSVRSTRECARRANICKTRIEVLSKRAADYRTDVRPSSRASRTIQSLNPQLAVPNAANHRARWARAAVRVHGVWVSRPIAMNRRRAKQMTVRRRSLPVVDINAI